MSAGVPFIVAWAALWLMLLGVCLWALRCGGPAEKTGATLILAAALVSGVGDLFAAANGLREHQSFLVGRLAVDGLFALGFLVASVRYASLWLGGAMLLHGLQFTLQSAYFVIGRPHDGLFSTINNLNFFGILVCLGLGTLAHLRRSAGSRTGAQRPLSSPT